MRRLLLCVLMGALGSTGLRAQAVQAVVQTKESRISYTGHHPAHDWTGTSGSVRGAVHLDPAQPAGARVELSAPVESFDSGNDSRDSNMLDVVEADRHREVRFVSDAVQVAEWNRTPSGYAGKWIVRGKLTFHGKTRPVEVPVDVTVEGRSFQGEGRFTVNLGEFGVARPKLLFVPIQDGIDLAFSIRALLPD